MDMMPILPETELEAMAAQHLGGCCSCSAGWN
jgi:hypothetical protein